MDQLEYELGIDNRKYYVTLWGMIESDLILKPDQFVDISTLGVPLEIPRRIEDVNDQYQMGNEEIKATFLNRLHQPTSDTVVVLSASCRTKVAEIRNLDGVLKSVDRQRGQEILAEVVSALGGCHMINETDMGGYDLRLITAYGPNVFWRQRTTTYTINNLPGVTLERMLITDWPPVIDSSNWQVMKAEWTVRTAHIPSPIE